MWTKYGGGESGVVVCRIMETGVPAGTALSTYFPFTCARITSGEKSDGGGKLHIALTTNKGGHGILIRLTQFKWVVCYHIFISILKCYLTKQSYRFVGYQLKFLISWEQPVKSETLWYFIFYLLFL